MKLYRAMKMPPRPLSVSTWITDEHNPVQAGPSSRRAVMIPLLLIQYGSLMDELRVFVHLRDSVSKAIADMHRAAKSNRDNPRNGHEVIDPRQRKSSGG